MVRFVVTFLFNVFHASAIITRTCDSSAIHGGSGSARLGGKSILI